MNKRDTKTFVSCKGMLIMENNSCERKRKWLEQELFIQKHKTRQLLIFFIHQKLTPEAMNRLCQLDQELLQILVNQHVKTSDPLFNNLMYQIWWRYQNSNVQNCSIETLQQLLRIQLNTNEIYQTFSVPCTCLIRK